MTERKSIIPLLFLAVLAEAVLLVRGGLLEWILAGDHSEEEIRTMIFDWRTMMSVALVTVILWLAYRWFRAGGDDGTGPQ